MLINLVIWILAIGKTTWEYDKFFSNPQFEKNLSESHHFIFFSIILTIILYKLYDYFFPTNKDKLIKSIYWIIFITLLSASCQNDFGKDINFDNFVSFSITMLYCMYIHKQFYPSEENFILPKIIIIWLIVLKILWSPIVYVWPYWPRKQRPYPEDLFDDWFYVDL